MPSISLTKPTAHLEIELSTDVAVRGRGEIFTAPLAQSKKFADGPTRHHRPFYDDYDTAKQHIYEALGEAVDTEMFDANVLCAVFCRPNITPNGIYLPVKEIREDWYQHKVVLILNLGPDAFRGDPGYLDSRFGLRDADGEIIVGTGKERSPRPGEWLFASASAGIQTSLAGDDGRRPQGIDHRGEPMDIFEWDGWPCRIIPHDAFYGRISKPHQVV
jgi:hypothetical protein